jgi:DNA-3-methyladenine glycosylase
MFARSGTLYVYPIHSRHCMNVVSEPAGKGAAVLLRAAEPLSGWKAMWKNRFADKPSSDLVDGSATPQTLGNEIEPPPMHLARQLSQGPGRLCECMDVDRRFDGIDLQTSNQVWFETPHETVEQARWQIKSSPRIGISKAQRLQLRWFIDGHRFVSGRAKEHSAGKHWSFVHEP